MTENQWRDHIAAILREHGWRVSLTHDSRRSPAGEPDLRVMSCLWTPAGPMVPLDPGGPVLAFNIEIKARDAAGRRRHRTDAQRRWANDAIMSRQPTIEILIPDDLDQLERYCGLPEGALTPQPDPPGVDLSDHQPLARERIRKAMTPRS